MSIAAAVEAAEGEFNKLPLAIQTKMHKALNIDFRDYVLYQQTQSQAHAAGKLATETAQFIYESLGRSHEDFNKQSLGVKYAVTIAIRNILGGE